jgi:hypothetical protein
MPERCLPSAAINLISLRRSAPDLAGLAQVGPQSEADRPRVIGSMLVELQRLGLSLQSADRFQTALHTMNRAAHAVEVKEVDASEAAEIAAAFLTELRTTRNRNPS